MAEAGEKGRVEIRETSNFQGYETSEFELKSDPSGSRIPEDAPPVHGTSTVQARPQQVGQESHLKWPPFSVVSVGNWKRGSGVPF